MCFPGEAMFAFKSAVCTYIKLNYYHSATILPNLKPQFVFIILLEPIKDVR